MKFRKSGSPVKAGDPGEPLLPIVRRSLLEKIKDRLWGYDFFISYHWASGGTYAVNLAAQLRENGYDVFLDRAEYAMGDKWKGVGEVALKNTQRLVLIATREAVFDSKPVEREIRLFTDRSRHCIPIFFGDTFTSEEPESSGGLAVLERLPGDTLHIEDTKENLPVGPAPEVIEKLAASHQVMSRRKIRQRITATAVTLLSAFAFFAGIFWLLSVLSEEEAKRRLAESELSIAGGAIRENRTAEGLHWYLRVTEDAPHGDPAAGAGRRLLGAGARKLQATMVHDDEVYAVAFSPDESMVLTGSWDKTARIWDVETGKPLGGPLVHERAVVSVAFSPDGKTAVTGSADKTVRLWDISSGRAEGNPLVLSHDDIVEALDFSPDGRTLVTGSYDKSARLWSVETGELLGKIMRHDGAIICIEISPTGKLLVTGSEDGTARLWGVENGEPWNESLAHGGPIYDLAFSPDGQRVASASEDGTARLWDAISGRPIGGPMVHEGSVYALAFSPDGSLIATGSGDGTSRVWDASTGGPLGFTMNHENAVENVAFSPDGQMLLTGSATSARLWDIVTGNQLRTELIHEGGLNAILFAKSGGKVVTASSDKTARLWNVFENLMQSAPLVHGNMVTAASFSPDGQTVLTGCSDGTSQLWDVDVGRPLGDVQKHGEYVFDVAFNKEDPIALVEIDEGTMKLFNARTGGEVGALMKHEYSVVTAVLDSGGSLVISGAGDVNRPTEGGVAQMWDASTGIAYGPALPHAAPVMSVAFGGDLQIMTGSLDANLSSGEARLWNPNTGISLDPLKLSSAVSVVAFSPDGKTAITASEDKKTQLWNARSGKKLRRPFQHPAKLQRIEFSPDGQLVLTSSDDDAARLWDAYSDQALGEPFLHHGVIAVEFSPDGQTILTGSRDGSAILWTVPPPAAEEPERLRLSVEVRTGAELDEDSGTLSYFSQAEWLERQTRLWNEFGGPCDVRQWDQVSEEEKEQLRRPPIGY